MKMHLIYSYISSMLFMRQLFLQLPVLSSSPPRTISNKLNPENKWKYNLEWFCDIQVDKWQGLQILLMSGVSVTSASQILESFWNIWSQVSQRKEPFSDFPAHGPGMYTLSWGIHEVAVAVCWSGKLKSMMAVIE